MKKYKSVRIEEKTHVLLKEYCQKNGGSLGWLIDRMIRERTIPKNILKVDN